MRQFLHVLSFTTIAFLTSCASPEPIPTDMAGCTMRQVQSHPYSVVEFDCPPGVWERMMARHLAFHPNENLAVYP